MASRFVYTDKDIEYLKFNTSAEKAQAAIDHKTVDLVKYSEDQPRDERGRFGSGGSSDSKIPSHVNIKGTRLNEDKRTALREKVNAVEDAQMAALQRITGESTFYNLTNEQRQEILNSPEVRAAQDALQKDEIYKFVASQPAFNDDRTLGPKTIGELGRGDDVESPMDRFARLGSTPNELLKADYSTPAKVYLKDEQGNYVLDERGVAKVEEVNLTKDEALAIARDTTSKYLAEANPTYVCSNKALSSILANGEVKTYVNADRPARAGATGEGYLNRRASYEAAVFGYKSDDPNRPISTFITDKTNYVNPELLEGYGGTRLILNSDVTDRTTVTSGDSLNLFRSPTPYADYGKRVGEYEAKSIAAATQVNQPLNTVFQNLEAQVHGGITTSDISKVVFLDKAPVNVASKLDKLGIPYEVQPKAVK